MGPTKKQHKPKPALTPTQQKKLDDAAAQKRAEIQTRHARLGKRLCPYCEHPAPKMYDTRPAETICENPACGKRYHTYPGGTPR